MDSAKRVMSGTHGYLWLDGEPVGEILAFQAKVEMDKEAIPRCGHLWEDYKVKGISGKGSLKLHKVSSRMIKLLGEKINNGQDPRFTIMSKLDDPDAYGAERVCIREVSFDNLTLADWEAKVSGKTECPFTFSGYELLDLAS